MLVNELGLMPYRQAWAEQEAAHAAVVEGGAERLLLVEHPPVVTFGRRPGQEKNVRATGQRLAELGVEVVRSDRGGDVTFHGPGQLVAYPIIRLADHRLSVGAYVQRLQDVVIVTVAQWGIQAKKDSSAIGVWVDGAAAMIGRETASDDQNLSTIACGFAPAKLCALGVRIRRGVSLHGIALNVSTDLRYFELIVPCGLAACGVTSLRELLGTAAPTMERVKEALVGQMRVTFRPGER